MENTNIEIYKDPYPEVTLAYKIFERTSEKSYEDLFDKLEPEVTELNQKFRDVLEYVSEKEGALDQKFITLEEEMVSPAGLPSLIRHYLEWDNKQDEFRYVSCLISDNYKGKQPSKHIPGSNDFIGFAKWRKKGFRRDEGQIVPNLPNPKKDRPGYSRFKPVTYSHDEFISLLKERHGKNGDFVSLVGDFEQVSKDLEEKAVKEKEKLGKKIRDRALQLNDSIKRISVVSNKLLPKYINMPPLTESLIENENVDIYFFPKKGVLKRVKLKLKGKKPNFKKGSSDEIVTFWRKLKPDLKETQDASYSDWFDVGTILIPELVSRLATLGWKKPT